MKLIIQIPCYNEESTIVKTIRDLPTAIDGIDEIVVLLIDDGSSDQTAKVGLIGGADFVIQHPYNRGLAKAFITGIQTSLALGADIIVNTDADNQYPGKYISDLVKPILENRAGIVIGDRQVIKNLHFSPIKRILEAFGSWVMRKVSSTDFSDAPSGFRAYSRFTASHLRVYNRYSYTLETLIQAGKEKIPGVEVPIETNPATRPSRLHKGLLNFIWRQAGTIIRSYVLYEPLHTFFLLSLPFILSSVVLIGRFLYFYISHQAGVGRYVQSVTLGGTLGIFGFLLVLMGLIGDGIKSNRQMIEDLTFQARESNKISKDDMYFLGYRLLRKKDYSVNNTL